MTASALMHRRRQVDAPVAWDLRATLRPLQRGTGDPNVRVVSGGEAWIACWVHPPDSVEEVPATLRIRSLGTGSTPATILVDAWSPQEWAAQQLVDSIETFVGIDARALEGWDEFDRLLPQWRRSATGRMAAAVEKIADARHRHPGLRFTATQQLVEQMFRVVLEQKVTHDQARATWRWVVRGYGTPAPRPAGGPELILPPLAEDVLGIPSWQWHQGWVQPALARTMRVVADRADALTRISGSDAADLNERVQSLPGIGPWTMAETLQRTHGSPDLISVGDFHLAHHVGEFFTGRRATDEQMVELLEPFAGHRQRMVRLMYRTGARFSRFGPRLAPADYRAF